MTIESILTRQLDITFLDARGLCTEAKLNLGILSYPATSQMDSILQEAIRIFRQVRSVEERAAMKRQKGALDAIRIPSGSLSSMSSRITRSDHERMEDSMSSLGGSMALSRHTIPQLLRKQTAM